MQALESPFTRAEKNEARGGDTRPVLSYAYYLQGMSVVSPTKPETFAKRPLAKRLVGETTGFPSKRMLRELHFTWILKSLNFPWTGPA